MYSTRLYTYLNQRESRLYPDPNEAFSACMPLSYSHSSPGDTRSLLITSMLSSSLLLYMKKLLYSIRHHMLMVVMISKTQPQASSSDMCTHYTSCKLIPQLDFQTW